MTIGAFTKWAVAAALAWCVAAARAQEVTNIGSWAGSAWLERITYANGLFLAAAGTFRQSPAGATATSTDGLYWTPHTPTGSPIVGTVWALAPGPDNFVAVGDRRTYWEDPSGTNGFIQLSADGVTWGAQTITPLTPLRGVAYGHGTYAAVGVKAGVAAVLTSSDGVLWATRSFPGYGGLDSIALGGGTFVAVGDAGTILTSADGTGWLAQTAPASGAIYYVGYADGMFQAGQADVGEPASPWHLLTSSHGTNWMASGALLQGPFAYANGLYVGIGRGGNDVGASTNGADWVTLWELGPIAEGGALSIAYGAGQFDVLLAFGAIVAFGPRASLGCVGETTGAADLTLTGGWLGMEGRLQASTNLSTTNWTTLLSFTNSGSVVPLRDPGASNYTRRFYRAAIP